MSTLPNLTVTAAAASRQMAELSTIKTEMGITGSESDTQLNRLIVAVSMYFAGPEGIDREPWLQTYQELLPGRGGHYLWLSRWPLLTISSITEGIGDSPTTVDATTYSIAATTKDRVYREDGWSEHTTSLPETYTDTTGPALAYKATYQAGWVMPDQITEWAASTAVSGSAWIKSTDLDEPFIFQADSGGGTTSGTEPTWPTVEGGTVVDNDITWTAYDQRLPQDLEEAAMMQVMDWFSGGLKVPSGVSRESYGPMSVSYWREGRTEAINPAVQAIAARYR